MDVTPLVPAGRQYINRYGPTGFVVSKQPFTGPILVFPEHTEAWDVGGEGDWETRLTAESFAAIFAADPPVEILLLGCGAKLRFIPPAVRQAIKAAGPSLEPMDTGAACRTYNVLMTEDRRVAAALMPTG